MHALRDVRNAELVLDADDIADDPHLEPEAKTAQLDALERALVSGTGNQAWLAPALQLKASLTATGVSGLHARQMLQAFRRDAQGGRCKTWQDLVLYCRYSANPVGRYLLELHGENLTAAASADALCTALQVLNHLQDCRDDWVRLGRCYLPTAWFVEAGGDPEQLVETRSSPAVRAVIDRTLDQVDGLLERASLLPGLVADPGLRLESAVILRLAQTLSARLRRRDPLAERVELGTVARGAAAARGLLLGLRVGRRNRASRAAKPRFQGGSTFYWPMRLLPEAQRRAMFAVYGFCRRVDDIVDEPGPPELKRSALADWRQRLAEIYAAVPPRGPEAPLLSAMGEAVRRYRLPRAEFDAMIDGMLMDLDGPVVAPTLKELTLYCRRVAGSVGMLSVRIFGHSDARADAFALAVAEALQLTNILRDVGEDARMGRLYLPDELLRDAGIDGTAQPPEELLSHPALPGVCENLADIAEARFHEARGALAELNGRSLWAAAAMMVLYQRLLVRLRRRGWADLDSRPRLSGREKFSVALRCAAGWVPAR